MDHNGNDIYFNHKNKEINVTDVLRNNKYKKIYAIKEFRSLTGISLKESKLVIDNAFLGKVTKLTHNQQMNSLFKENLRKDATENTIRDYEKENIGNETTIKKGSFFPTLLFVLVFFTVLDKVILKDGSIFFRNASAIVTVLIVTLLITIIVRFSMQKSNEKQIFIFKGLSSLLLVFFVIEFLGKNGIIFFIAISLYLISDQESKKNDSIDEELLRLIFLKYENQKFLNDFVLNNTIKYDYGNITYPDYIELMSKFIDFLNIETQRNEGLAIDEHTDEKIKDFLTSTADYSINILNVEEYIDSKKMSIYKKNFNDILNINSIMNQKETIGKYINYFGDKSLNSLNIEILANVLEMETSVLTNKINKKQNQIVEEYNYNKLRKELFSDKSIMDIKYIDTLDGFEFEDYLVELFKSFGYRNEELPYTSDYGADLIITKGLQRIVIQAKNYNSGNVGNKAVQEILSAKKYYKCDIAIVITNSYFTKNAIELAKRSSVVMIERDQLKKILDKGAMYFNGLVSIAT